jgi:O-antigen/teichoic acid export membrane protein
VVALTRFRLLQLRYVPLLALAMGLMMLRTLVAARLLDVPAFAAFSLGLLVSSTFCMLACLGLQPLLQREMPVHIVRGRERAGGMLVAQSLTVALGCAGLAGAALAVSQLWADDGRMPLWVGLVHGLSQQFFVIATVESRSRGEPVRFARQNLLRAFAVLGAGTLAAALTGEPMLVLLAEAAMSFVLSGTVLAGVFSAARMAAVSSVRLGWRRMSRLPWRAAFALLALSIVGFLLTNVDRWIAAQSLDVQEFAHYAFAWMVLMVGQSAQTLINASVFPMLARRQAAVGLPRAYSVAARISLAGLAVAGLGALPLWWLLDYVVVHAFPAYQDARPLIGLFIAAAVLRVSDFWSSLLVIAGREAALLAANLAGAAIAGAGWWIGLQLLQLPMSAVTIGWLALLLSLAAHLVAAMLALKTVRSR